MRKTITASLTAISLMFAVPQSATADVSNTDLQRIIGGVAGLAIIGALIHEANKDRKETVTPQYKAPVYRHQRPVIERHQPHFRVAPVPRAHRHGHHDHADHRRKPHHPHADRRRTVEKEVRPHRHGDGKWGFTHRHPMGHTTHRHPRR